MLDFGFYNMDCMEGMKEFPDKYFELAVVDPPYGVDAGNMTMGSGRHNFSRKSWDKNIPEQRYFHELFRVSKNQIIWGGNYFTEYLPPSKHWLIWDKCNPNLSFSEAEVAWVYDGKLMRIFKHYSARVDGDSKIHPTQKPVALYKWILSNYAKDGDKILDTHVGSASSLIACEDMGFKYVGFELDETYYKLASERLKTHKSQVSIMDIMGDWR